jgi:hypothetical protein
MTTFLKVGARVDALHIAWLILTEFDSVRHAVLGGEKTDILAVHTRIFW